MVNTEHQSQQTIGYTMKDLDFNSVPVVLDKEVLYVSVNRVVLCNGRYEQPNWEVDPSKLPPTQFLARPMDEDSLPPITTYYFYVDASYRSAICQPTSFGSCSYVRLHQEDFADEIRWFLNNEASMAGVGNSSLVYIWPYECNRVGFEDKIEVMATTLQVGRHAAV